MVKAFKNLYLGAKVRVNDGLCETFEGQLVQIHYKEYERKAIVWIEKSDNTLYETEVYLTECESDRYFRISLHTACYLDVLE